MRNNLGQFKKGHSESREEKLHRIASFKEAIKKSDRYLGELKKSPLYNCWRAFMFTKKGKKAGISKSWEIFKNFYFDMIPTYSQGKRLQRIDKTQEFSKENCIWCTEQEATLLKDNIVMFEYNGKTQPLKQWALELDIYYPALRQRFYKGKNYTSKEILFGKIRNGGRKPIIDISKYGYQGRKDKISKMLSAYRCKDKKRGFEFNITHRWFAENIITQPCTYCGNTKNVGCDRIDNSKGHTIENVIPACYDCNTLRRNRFNIIEMKKIGEFLKNEIYPKRLES